MFIRRTFFRWQFPAVIVLPLWLLIGSSIFGTGGWAVLGIFFGAVLLGLGMLIVSLFLFARREVREERALSWIDVGVLAVWHALIIALGLASDPSGWLSVLVIVVGIGAFWYAVWALFSAARKRVRAMLDLIEQTAAGTAPASPLASPPMRPRTEHGASTPPPSGRANDPEVIVIKETPHDAP
ncbi:MFS transporter [Cryobacterium psychrophilum]|uniref:MFS transporter n=1 Tax=Cryobacterium psychrophilum TaxID=41988 RepID=A0A4Y8KRE5_9MICO|nr:MFS transporter [Cryobacterium psychrophilum]TDW31224.1 hypothetical protein EDD25_3026 [Cryobacterium psychrophilum]TFD78484.1 MFS transporter [Cryobacterium psychrophilum]